MSINHLLSNQLLISKCFMTLLFTVPFKFAPISFDYLFEYFSKGSHSITCDYDQIIYFYILEAVDNNFNFRLNMSNALFNY